MFIKDWIWQKGSCLCVIRHCSRLISAVRPSRCSAFSEWVPCRHDGSPRFPESNPLKCDLDGVLKTRWRQLVITTRRRWPLGECDILTVKKWNGKSVTLQTREEKKRMFIKAENITVIVWHGHVNICEIHLPYLEVISLTWKSILQENKMSAILLMRICKIDRFNRGTNHVRSVIAKKGSGLRTTEAIAERRTGTLRGVKKTFFGTTWHMNNALAPALGQQTPSRLGKESSSHRDLMKNSFTIFQIGPRMLRFHGINNGFQRWRPNRKGQCNMGGRPDFVFAEGIQWAWTTSALTLDLRNASRDPKK